MACLSLDSHMYVAVRYGRTAAASFDGFSTGITCVANAHVLLCTDLEQSRQISSKSLHLIYSPK